MVSDALTPGSTSPITKRLRFNVAKIIYINRVYLYMILDELDLRVFRGRQITL